MAQCNDIGDPSSRTDGTPSRRPWKAVGLAVRSGDPPNHEWVAFAGCAIVGAIDYANINLIAECVNACDGMSDPGVEILGMKMGLKLANECIEEQRATIAMLRDRLSELGIN